MNILFWNLIVKNDPDSNFPEIIPSSDIHLDNQTEIWSPGTRMVSEIQKSARRMNMAYVATTTIGPGNSASGLLVVAHQKNQPSKNMISIMDVFGSTLSSVLQYYILVSTLRKQINSDHWKISVQNETLDQIVDGVLTLKDDFSIWYVNPSAELMLGYQIKEILTQPIENIIIGPEFINPDARSGSQ